jgi:hypothetical protein
VTAPTSGQRIAVIFEVETAASLVRAGLTELQYIDGANRFYRLPMTLLGQGLERLMKVAIALDHLQATGSLPTTRWMKEEFQHDLGRLARRCAEVVARPEYATSRTAAGDDAAFLADPELAQALAAAQGYAERERYADLDHFLDAAATTPDPGVRFDNLEWTILRRFPAWEARLGEAGFSGFYPVMVDELTKMFQRFARSIARLYVWGPLGELGAVASGPLTPLLTARDERLHELPKQWLIYSLSRDLRRSNLRAPLRHRAE